MSSVAVVGLGHMGLPLAALLAQAGHNVLGADRDGDHIARLRRGEVGWREPGLVELLRSLKGVEWTTHTTAAAAEAEVSVIAVPTPTDEDGGYGDGLVQQAVSAVGAGLGERVGPHLVVVLSTVMPGTCAGRLAPSLELRSGRKIGPDLGLCYSTAFGALGRLLRDYSQPDFLLIGQSDAAAGDAAAALFASIHQSTPPVLRRALIEAEIAKIALNNFIIAKIAFANMIGGLCQRIEGADADQVLSVLGRDRRIGPGSLRAAMPYGGPCFGRDAGAMAALGARHGLAMPLAAAADRVNAAHIDQLVGRIGEATPAGGTVAILGLAFRNDSDVLEASPAVAIARRLAEVGFRVRAWDPLAGSASEAAFVVAPSLDVCVRGADTVLIANDDPSCAAIPPIRRADGTRLVVFDYWRLIQEAAAGAFDIRRLAGD